MKIMKENGKKPNSACHQEHVQVLNSLTDTLKDELKRGLTLLDNCVNQLAQAKWILINVERTIEDFYADCPACDVKSKTGNSAVTPPSTTPAAVNCSSTPVNSTSTPAQSSSGGAKKSSAAPEKSSAKAKKASVLPMVSGHTVQRPKINISRVDSSKSKKSKSRTDRDTASASRVRSRGSGSTTLASITASASAGFPLDDSADESTVAAGAVRSGATDSPSRKKVKAGPRSKTRVTKSNSDQPDFTCDGADVYVDLDDINDLLRGKTFFKGPELEKFPQYNLSPTTETAPSSSKEKPEQSTSTAETNKKRKLTISSESDEEPLENRKKTVASNSKVTAPESSSSTPAPKITSTPDVKPKISADLLAKLKKGIITKLKTGTATKKLSDMATPSSTPASDPIKKSEEGENGVVNSTKKEGKTENSKEGSGSESDSKSKPKASVTKKSTTKSSDSDESEPEVIPSKVDRRSKPADRHNKITILNAKKRKESSDDSDNESLRSKNRVGSKAGARIGRVKKKDNSSGDSDPEFVISPSSKKSRSRSAASSSKAKPSPPKPISSNSKFKSRATISSDDDSNSDSDSGSSTRGRKSKAKKSATATAARTNKKSESKSPQRESEGKSKSAASRRSVSSEKQEKVVPMDMDDENKSIKSVDLPDPPRQRAGPASSKAKRTGGRPGPLSAKLKLQEKKNDDGAMDVDGSDKEKDKEKVSTTNAKSSARPFSDSGSDDSEMAKIKKNIPLDLQDAVRSPSPNPVNSTDLFGKLLSSYNPVKDSDSGADAPTTPLQKLKSKAGKLIKSKIFELNEHVTEKLSAAGRLLVPYTGPIEMSDEVFSPGKYYIVGKFKEEKLVLCDEGSELQELDLNSEDIEELMDEV